METNDIATIGYASQTLAFAVVSALFLGRWGSRPFSRHLGLASSASSVSGAVLTVQSLGYIGFDAVVVLAEWARNAMWIIALFAVLLTLDRQRLAENYATRFGLPVLAVALAGLAIYSSRKLDSLGVTLVVSGGILMALMLISLLEQIYRNPPRTALQA